MDENMKPHDWIMELLANPTYTTSDFKNVGINADNSTVLDRNVYLSSDNVKSYEIFQTEGKFDEQKFNQFYNYALENYNRLSEDTYDEDLLSRTVYTFDSVLSPENLRAKEMPAEVTPTAFNPFLLTKGLIELDQWSPQTKSAMEIAEGLMVLANPEDVANGAEPIWLDPPEESFFDNFDETRVLALWDFNADIDGNPTDDPSKIAYHLGELKYNDLGTFYFENLGNRSIYGRQVLSKLNILTKEDSWINSIDIFDSDDLKKSTTGTIVKNVISIIPMLIPQVRPFYIAAGLGMELTNLGAVLGKMAMGSDVSSLSKVEGFIASLRPSTSEYAMQHTWCSENLINMAGETFKFLYSQKWLFKNAPALFKGSLGSKSEAEKANLMATWAKDYSKTRLAKIKASTTLDDAEKLRLIQSVEINAQSYSQNLMDTYMRNYNKLGEVISRAYMASTFGASMYGEAKAQGLSDNEASAVTLGYMAGQWALLSSHVGNWIFPETKLPKIEQKAIAKALFKNTKALEKEVIENTPKVEKMAWFNKKFNAGKLIAKDLYNPTTTAFKATAGGTVAGGIEMMSFELLHDLTTSLYNLYNWMSDSDSPKMSSFDNVLERYSTGFLGGAMGGLFFAPSLNFKFAKSLENMTYESAIQKMVYMYRNGTLDKFAKEVGKIETGNKNLSYKLNEDGKSFKAGTKDDNRNIDNQLLLLNYINFIKKIGDATGSKISDPALLELTVKDIRFSLLLKSTVVLSVIQDFNSTVTEILKLSQELNQQETAAARIVSGDKTDQQKRNDKKNNKSEVPTLNEKLIAEKQKQLDEAIERKNKFINGEFAPEYIGNAIFEMSLALNDPYMHGYFKTWAEHKLGKAYEEIPLNTLAQLKGEYKEFVGTNKKDIVREAYKLFKTSTKYVSELLNNAEYFKNKSKEIDILEKTSVESIENLLLNPEISEFYEFINKSFFDVDNKLLDLFGTPESKLEFKDIIDKYKKQVELTLKDLESTDVIPEDINQNVKLLGIQLLRDLKIFFENSSTDIVFNLLKNITKNVKFINPEVKEFLLDISKKAEEKLYLDSNWDMTADIKYTELLDYKAKLLDIPETPIVDLINKYILKLTNKEINISAVLLKFNTQFYNNKLDIGNFGMPENDIKLLDNLISMIEMFRSGIFAAEKTKASTTNIFGYNTTMNELVKGSNLAEISLEKAEITYKDINTILTKLKLFKKLISINASLKLKESLKVDNNTDFIFFRRAKEFANNLPSDWEKVDELKNFIESDLQDLDHLSQAGSLNLNPTLLTLVFKLTIQLLDKIWEFFLANEKNMADVDKMSKFLSPKNFNIYALDKIKNYLITLTSNSIDDNSFIYLLATWAAVKSSDFHAMVQRTLQNDIAPLGSQEMTLMTCYNTIKNGKIFDYFINGYKKSILDNYDHYVKLCEQKHLDHLEKNLLLEADFTPRFSRINFIEGAAGSGKSSVIFSSIIKFLKSSETDSKRFLNNIWVASTEDLKKSNKKQNPLNVPDTSKILYLNKKELMENISPDWFENVTNGNIVLVTKDMYKITPLGTIESTFKLKETKDIPSLILIDEVSHYTALDMDLLNKFAEKYDIPILAAGDLTQTGLYGKIENFNGKLGVTFLLNLQRNLFIRSPKLSVSMRTGYKQLNSNSEIFEANLDNLCNFNYSNAIDLRLRYFKDSENLYGTEVFHLTDNNTTLLSRLEDTVRLMVKSLKEGETIGFVYDDVNSDTYKMIMSKYKDYVTPFKGSSSQGFQKRYFIANITGEVNSGNCEYIYRNIYTTMTRTSLGSVLIFNNNDPRINVEIGNSKMDSYVEPEINNSKLIQIFVNNRRRMYKEVLTGKEAKEIKYIERGKISSATPAGNIANTNPPVEDPTTAPVEDPATAAPTENPTTPVENPATPTDVTVENLKETPTDVLAETPKSTTEIDSKIEVLNLEADQELLKALEIASQTSEQESLVKNGYNYEIKHIDAILNNLFKLTNIQFDPKEVKVVKLKDLELLMLPESLETNLLPVLYGSSQNSKLTISKPKLLYILEGEHLYPVVVNTQLTSTLENKQNVLNNIKQNSTDIKKELIVKRKKPITKKVNVNTEGLVNEVNSDFIQNSKIINTEQLKVNLYSEFCHDLGIIFDGKDWRPSLKFLDRIDNINGLQKLGILQPDNLGIFSEHDVFRASKLIETLKSYLYNTSSNIELVEKFKELLNININPNLNKDTFYLTYAFKIHSADISYANKNDINNKFVKDFENEIQYKDTHSGKKYTSPSHYVEIILGSKEHGNLLEIPLFKLPNWETLAQSPLVDETINAKYQTISNLDYLGRKNEMEKFFKSNMNLLGAESLYKLLKVRNIYNNMIIYLNTPDWTLLKDFKASGINTILGPRGYGYRGNEEMKTSGNWEVLSPYYSSPFESVSDIYMSVTGLYEINGETYNIARGTPFILTSDISIPKLMLRRLFIQELSLPLSERKVKLYPIVTPEATVAEYFENIFNLIHKLETSNIGNDFTNYRIIEALFTNETTKNKLNEILKRRPYLLKTFSTLETTILEIRDLEKAASPEDKFKVVYNKLQSLYDINSNNPTKTLNIIILNALYKFVYGEHDIEKISMNTPEIPKDEKIKNNINLIQEALGDKVINYHLSYDPNDTETFNEFMRKVKNTNLGYLNTSFGLKNFLIRRLETPSVYGDITPILDTILYKIRPNPQSPGTFKSVDTASYLNLHNQTTYLKLYGSNKGYKKFKNFLRPTGSKFMNKYDSNLSDAEVIKLLNEDGHIVIKSEDNQYLVFNSLGNKSDKVLIKSIQKISEDNSLNNYNYIVTLLRNGAEEKYSAELTNNKQNLNLLLIRPYAKYAQLEGIKFDVDINVDNLNSFGLKLNLIKTSDLKLYELLNPLFTDSSTDKTNSNLDLLSMLQSIETSYIQYDSLETFKTELINRLADKNVAPISVERNLDGKITNITYKKGDIKNIKVLDELLYKYNSNSIEDKIIKTLLEYIKDIYSKSSKVEPESNNCIKTITLTL